ncbi:MAG: hypothetical protein ABIE22_01740 [archaeon]
MVKSSTRARTPNSMSKIVSCKRSQEEMVGFVLIIVIVCIVALVFLGMAIRRGPEISESERIASFLESMMLYTTECAVGFEPQYQDIGELIKACESNEPCLDDKTACEVLETELEGILGESWQISEDKPTTYYKLRIAYVEEEFEDILLIIEQGNCTGNLVGASSVISKTPGKILTSAEICSRSL